MAKQGRQPNHGEWFVEDQTRTSNGFRLLRYHAGTLNDEGTGWVQYPGWHEFGYFASSIAAIKAQAGFEDRMPNGDPWLAPKGRDQLVITRLQRVEQRRAEYDGTPVHGATLANAACAACGAIEGDPDASAIGLCATCDAGPLCDSCADQHEATARHPATL